MVDMQIGQQEIFKSNISDIKSNLRSGEQVRGKKLDSAQF
jgi:hypothetical protein